jgi:hypothetical protein
MQIAGKRGQGGARLSSYSESYFERARSPAVNSTLSIRPAQSARIFIARNTIEKPPESFAEVLEITCPQCFRPNHRG